MEENLTHQVWQLKIIHLALIHSWTNFFRIKRGIDSQINKIILIEEYQDDWTILICRVQLHL